MRAVIGRLRRLENRVGPQRYMERQRLADLLRDRRRRRLEASGEPFEDLPLEGVAPGPVRYLSVPETLRLGLSRIRERKTRRIELRWNAFRKFCPPVQASSCGRKRNRIIVRDADTSIASDP